MAGVNNPPNFKPLFDMQGQTIVDEIQNSQSAINFTVSTSGDAVLSAISNLSAANTNRINGARDALYGYMSNYRNLTREQIEGIELDIANSKAEIISGINQSITDSTYNDIFSDPNVYLECHAGTTQRFGNAVTVNSPLNSLQTVYSRNGAGVLTYLYMRGNSMVEIYIDGVLKVKQPVFGSEATARTLVALNSSNESRQVLPYLRYKSSIEIKAIIPTYNIVFSDAYL